MTRQEPLEGQTDFDKRGEKWSSEGLAKSPHKGGFAVVPDQPAMHVHGGDVPASSEKPRDERGALDAASEKHDHRQHDDRLGGFGHITS